MAAAAPGFRGRHGGHRTRMEINGSVFAVTGAGSGIGRAVALELLRRGGRVAGADRSEPGLREMQELAAAGDRLSTHTLDITDRPAVDAFTEEVVRRHGQVDGAVNVAGIIQRFVPVTDLGDDEIDRLMAVNFWGTVHVDRAFLPLLLRRPSACLVNVASIGAIVPSPGQGAYGASKAAVMLLTECLYAELRGTSVAVTLVVPGGTGTNIAANSGVEVPDWLMPKGNAPRTADPDDVARRVVDAIARGRFRVLIGRDTRMLDLLARIAPTRAIDTVARRMTAMMEQSRG